MHERRYSPVSGEPDLKATLAKLQVANSRRSTAKRGSRHRS